MLTSRWPSRSYTLSTPPRDQGRSIPDQQLSESWRNPPQILVVTPATIPRELGVDRGGVERVRAIDDEFLTRTHIVAHQHLEGGLGDQTVVHRHAAQRTVPGIHRRLGQLVGIHLAKPLVTLWLLEVQTPLGELSRLSLVFRIG